MLMPGLFPQTDAPATSAPATDVPVPDDDEEEAEAEAEAADGDDDAGDDQGQLPPDEGRPPGGPPPPAPPPAGAEQIVPRTAPTAQAASPPERDPRFPDGRPGPSSGPEQYAIGTPGDPHEEEEEEEDKEKNKALQAQIEERARQLGEVRRFPSDAFSDPHERKPKPLRPAALPSNIFEFTGETDYETGRKTRC